MKMRVPLSQKFKMASDEDKLSRRGKHCCVFDCTNSYYDKNGHRTRVHFFQFPLKPARKRDRWCNLIKRQNNIAGFRVTSNTVICDTHFAPEDIHKTLAGRWKLKKDVEPSIFSWSTEKKKRPSPKKRVPTPPKIPKRNVASTKSSSNQAESKFHDVGVQTESNICVIEQESLTALHEELMNKQTRIDELTKQIKDLQDEVEKFRQRQFTLEKIKDDDDAIHFYTGFPNNTTLISFFEYVEPKLTKMKYWTGEKNNKEELSYQCEAVNNKPGPKRKLSHLTEFFIALLRLKAGLYVQDLSDRFLVSTGLISKITITWLCLLRHELPLLFPFPSQELVHKNMPEEFCEFPTTRIILDCTEIYIQRRSSMLTQSQTWSDYKHHNTLKALVGISPNGQVTYISDLWGGRASDKLITKESGVLNLVEPGDNIMVDRGFEIDDIVPLGVHVNMPPFLGSRDQMTAEETEKTMKIASVRIHVERAIGRIKNYHILDGNLPLSLAPYANQIFFVCSFLTNFLPPLLKKNEQS